MVEIPATNSILHTHSMYSMFDSTQTPDEMVARAKELGCKNITLTDHGTLLGVEPFMDAGIKHDVNTIPGVEAYLEHRRHLLLIAKDYEGYQQISFAMRDANLHIEKVGKHMTFPIMENWILEKYFKGNEHVIATTACIQGLPGHTLLLNYQIKQKIQKKQQELDTKRESYECYRAVEKQIRSITDKIKLLEKEKTSYKKYLSPAYENKIVKLKKAILSAEKELEDMLPDEGIRAEAKKKHQKAMQEYELAMNSRELANHQVPLIDKEISQLKEEKKQREKQKKQYLSGRNRYMKILDELNEMHLIPEEELYQKAREQLGYLKSIFPNLFVELQYHGMEQEAYVMPLLVKLADELQIPVIAGNDAHMSDGSKNCIEARRIIRFNYFETSQTVSEADRTLYLKSNEELFEALSQAVGPETALTAIRNTEVLNQCKVVLPTDPHYPVVKDGPSFDELLEEARQKRIAAGTWNEIYEARLRHEIQVIKSMGYVDYHMVVRDFCFMGRKLGVIPKKELKNLPEDFSKLDEWLATKNFRTGIGIGPGRGSAAGSLVCFLLGITNIDPIKYNLLFERE